MLKKFSLYGMLAVATLLLFSTHTYAFKKNAKYAVTITNLTPGQTFTPILVATHNHKVSLFTLGSPASTELSTLAEGGDIQPLTDLLTASGNTADTQTNGALLAPGKSVTIKVTANPGMRFISLAAMLIPTNDAFVSLNRVPLPLLASSHYAFAYDAGSEPNDELCANIPGPVCGGEGTSANAGGEGYVHIHSGIHGIGDLKANVRDWRNPVARIVIRRVF